MVSRFQIAAVVGIAGGFDIVRLRWLRRFIVGIH